MSIAAPHVRADGLVVRRGGRRVIDGLSFTLDPGALLWLTGPNGVGKSTVLRVLAGLLRPATGLLAVTVPVALADERPALDADAPLVDALDWWRRFDGGALPARDALHAVGLTTIADVPVRHLSTGQRRRAALARLLTGPARLWLLDEPANALDAAATGLLEGLVREHLSGGGSVVLASHVAIGDLGRLARTLPLDRPA